MPSSSSVLDAILSDASQTDSQADSIQTPEPDDPRRARALLIACITIALERFGFYTLVSLFVLFLTERRGQSEGQASTWYGVMMGATYFTPLFGGALADRFGRWLCICIGAFLLACAHGLLTAGFLPLSIILLSMGMGLFKSNITAAVGSLYPTEVERDLSLSRLYWAVNLGALPAGVVGGWLAKHYGYSGAFLSATVACLLAWCLWFSGKTLFAEHPTTAPGRVLVLPVVPPEWFLNDSVREGSHRSDSVRSLDRTAVVSERPRRTHHRFDSAGWDVLAARIHRQQPQVHARNAAVCRVQCDHVYGILCGQTPRSRQSMVAPRELLRDVLCRAMRRADRILHRDEARSQATLRSPHGCLVRSNCAWESRRGTHRKVLGRVVASDVLHGAGNDIGIRSTPHDAATESS